MHGDMVAVVERKPIQYFNKCFPMDMTPIIINYMNESINASQIAMNLKIPVTTGDFFSWLGIRLATVIEPKRGGIASYWSTKPELQSIYNEGNYLKRFGMSKTRFEVMLNHLRVGPLVDPQVNGEKDPWFSVRPFIDGFNNRQTQVIEPGPSLCVDECMSAWKGLSSSIAGIYGMPHVTKIPRKPEGVGTEMKSIACGDTKMIIGLDLMEGAVRNAAKEFNEFGAGTGQILRLARKYFGSGRLIVADSAFSSVKTCVELRNRGLFFGGVIKTAYKQFPKNYLTDWLSQHSGRNDRGKYKLLRSIEPAQDNRPEFNIYGLAWSDKKGKQFVFSTGITTEGRDSVRIRHKREWSEEMNDFISVQYEKRVKRPRIVEEIHDAFSTIDIHDHFRQGSLAIERQWPTKKWQIRIFETVFGMIITNSYLAYVYDQKMFRYGLEEPVMPFNDFLGMLAYQLVHNIFNEDEPNLRVIRNIVNPNQFNEVFFLFMT